VKNAAEALGDTLMELGLYLLRLKMPLADTPEEVALYGEPGMIPTG
jgi:hypothetical protein